MEHEADIAVVGGGFGGALMAMVARRLGPSVVLIERGRHPRFAIGESSTPLANLLLQQIAEEYDLPQLLPLRRWGEWQREHPEIGCGLKRGFSFFHHTLGQAFSDDDQRRIMPVSPLTTYPNVGEVCMSLPAVIGRNGIEHQAATPMDDSERAALEASARSIRETAERFGVGV